MTEAIFADTSGLYAAIVENDRRHGLCLPILTRLLEAQAPIHTTSYVVIETIALLQGRSGSQDALDFDEKVRPFLRITWIDEPIHSRAARLWRRHSRRKLSLVDCSSFVVMDELGLETAFAVDRHFVDEGFRTLPTVKDQKS